MNMKMKNIMRVAVVALAASSLSGCHIYNKYSTPTDTALTKAYAEARQAQVDSAAFGNLLWEKVFTDPKLAALIEQALQNNTNLRNAQLNTEIAPSSPICLHWSSHRTGLALRLLEATSAGATPCLRRQAGRWIYSESC